MTVTSQLNGSFECIAENRLKSVNSSVKLCPKLIEIYRGIFHIIIYPNELLIILYIL